MTMHQDGCKEPTAHGSLALRGGFGGVPSSCQNHLFRGSSLFLPCSPLAANVRFSLAEQKDASGRADELQDQGKFTGVHLGKLLFEHEVLFGHFANWF